MSLHIYKFAAVANKANTVICICNDKTIRLNTLTLTCLPYNYYNNNNNDNKIMFFHQKEHFKLDFI